MASTQNWHGREIRWHTCPHCGKRSYLSRKDAKLAARRRTGGADGMRPYQCNSDQSSWHLGHMSPAVRRGIYDRAERVDLVNAGKVGNG